MSKPHEQTAARHCPVSQPKGQRQTVSSQSNSEHQTLLNLFMQFPAPLCLFRFQDDGEPVYEFANQPYEELFGGHELSGRALHEALPELETQGVVDLIKNVYHTGKGYAAPEFPVTITKQSRSEDRLFDLHIDPVRNGDGQVNGVITFGYEVTEQVRARRELEQREAYYRRYAEAMPQMAFIADREGTISYYNQRWYDYVGSLEGTEGWGWQDKPVHHPDDLERTLDTWRNALKTGKSYEIEYRLRRHDGQFRWHLGRAEPLRNASGEIEQWLGTNTDIHDQKLTQQAVRDSEERLRFITDFMPQKVFTTDESGQVEYFNPEWLNYSGLTADELASEDMQQLTHPSEQARIHRLWKRSLRSGREFQMEHRLRGHDGRYRWHFSRIRPMSDDAGNVIMWIGACVDIEEPRRNMQLEQQTAELAHRQQQLLDINETKDEFISLASHQLRTPATGTKQYIGILLDGYAGKLSDEQQSMIRLAYECNERQLQIIDALLSVARLDAGKIRPKHDDTNINQLARDVAKEMRVAFASREQTIRTELPKRAITAVADSHLLRMVLSNLIDNAGKYSPPRSTITVSAHRSRQQIYLSVHDQGIGIKKADQAKLFQKFSRLDNEHTSAVTGSGMGLYWAKKVIDLHAGTITVTSKPRQGSTFTITLPH
jgi:PAS domain S-box-containing protein